MSVYRQNSRKIKFTFSLSVGGRSPYWSILKYYQQLPKETVRQLLLEAVSAYWSALAVKGTESGSQRETSGQTIACNLYQLRQQVNFLAAQFEVNEPVERISPVQYKAVEGVTFDFCYQVYDLSQSKLIEYLMDSTGLLSLEQKIFWSNLAYWGAIADRELGLLEPEQLNQSAANCIYRLRQHIDYLKNYFEYSEWEDVIPCAPNVRGSSLFLERSVVPDRVPHPHKEVESNGNGHQGVHEENLDDLFLNDPKNDEWRKDFFKRN